MGFVCQLLANYNQWKIWHFTSFCPNFVTTTAPNFIWSYNYTFKIQESVISELLVIFTELAGYSCDFVEWTSYKLTVRWQLQGWVENNPLRMLKNFAYDVVSCIYVLLYMSVCRIFQVKILCRRNWSSYTEAIKGLAS